MKAKLPISVKYLTPFKINTVAAIGAGAKYVDCTIGGIGERAGNCNFSKLLEALYCNKDISFDFIKNIENEIINIIYNVV